MRLLALGDSYTVGTAVDADQRWVSLLAERLRADGVAVDETRVVAADGWTTGRLTAAVERTSLSPPYDAVTLLVGANDAYRNRQVIAYRDGFVDLLERAVAFAGGDADRVVVLTIPDYSVTPHCDGAPCEDHAERIEAYNEAVREAAAEAGARLVDVAPSSRAVADDPSLVADDGLHPSPEQHERWLEPIYPVVRAALEG